MPFRCCTQAFVFQSLDPFKHRRRLQTPLVSQHHAVSDSNDELDDEPDDSESNQFPRKVEVAKLLVVGSAWVSTYFLDSSNSNSTVAAIKSALPVMDQIGLVLIFTAIVVSVGVFIRFQIWGELQFEYTNRFTAWAMRIPMELSANAQTFSEQVVSFISGLLFAIIAGIVAFVLGVVVDLLVELGVLLAILVPVGLAVGTWTLERWPPALVPIVGRAGFFLGIYGILSLLSFLWTNSNKTNDN